MKIAARSRLVFIGDSVTDCGRARPIGEGLANALGYGYVADVAKMLAAEEPTLQIRVTNMGVGGDTVLDLAARWSDDVLKLTPDWLSVMIGINDVWRQFDGLGRPENTVTPELFERTYDQLLEQTRPRLKGLVLLTPYYVEPSMADPMRRRMDEYGKIVKRLAVSHDAVCVDTQAFFDQKSTHLAFSDLAPDRVHPSPVGHKIIAQAFLDAVGFTATDCS